MTEQIRETDDATPCDESASLGVADGSSSTPAQWLDIAQRPLACKTLMGETLGVYRINSVLGQSTISTVYLAARVDQLYSAPAAIKVLNEGMASATLHQFVVEKYTLGHLNHPSIARLYDAGELADGRPYLVMEYVEGEPLDKYCDSRQLGIKERIELFMKVCSAVHYAHQHLVVHRDLKPGNILVTADGTPKLLDFGIAKWLDKSRLPEASQALTRINDRVLTPEYASPEQVTGRPITTTSDVYTLGVVLYELLSGSRPYQLPTRDHLEVERLICILDPSSPSHYFSSLPEEDQQRFATQRGETPKSLLKTLHGDLDAIAMRALRKEPTERYQSVEDLTDDLNRYLNGAPVAARQGNWLYYTKRFVVRHRVGLSVAALFLVCISVAATVVTLSTQKLIAERNNADHQKYKADTASSFWLGMFDRGAVLPNKQPDTALNLLDRAAEQIKMDTQLTPDIRAQLLVGIGKSYQGQLKPQLAISFLDKAINYIEKESDKNSSLYAVALGSLASAQSDIGQYNTAAHSINKAESILKTIQPTQPDTYLTLQKIRGEIELYNGNLKKSEETFNTAYKQALSMLGVRNPLTAELLFSQGNAKLWQGDNKAAVAYMQEAISISNETLPASHPNVISFNLAVALALSRTGNYKEAENIARQQLIIQQRTYGTENAKIAITLDFISATSSSMGKLKDAEQFQRRALEIGQKFMGDKNPQTQVFRTRLANILILEKKYKAAEDHLRISISLLNEFGNNEQYVAWSHDVPPH